MSSLFTIDWDKEMVRGIGALEWSEGTQWLHRHISVWSWGIEMARGNAVVTIHHVSIRFDPMLQVRVD